PEFPTGWYNRGLAGYQLQRYADAEASFARYMTLASDDDPLRPTAEKILGWLRSGEAAHHQIRAHMGERVDEKGRVMETPQAVAPPPVAPSPVAPPAPAEPEPPTHTITIDANDPEGPAKMLRIMAMGLMNSPTQQDQAEGVLRQWMQVEPRSAEPHSALGELLSRFGRLPEALAEFERAATLDPKAAGHP